MDGLIMACGAVVALAGVYMGAMAYSRGCADRGLGPVPRGDEPGDIFSPTREADAAEGRARAEMDAP